MLLGNRYLILSSYYSFRYIFPGIITSPDIMTRKKEKISYRLFPNQQ